MVLLFNNKQELKIGCFVRAEALQELMSMTYYLCLIANILKKAGSEVVSCLILVVKKLIKYL